jgi:type VI secretion system protein ImpH
VSAEGKDAPAPGPASPPRALTPLQRLQREPGRFSLDQAAAVFAPGKDPTELRWRTVTRLSAPAGEVALARSSSGDLQTPTFGLVGPGGVMPRHYTAWIDGEARRHSPALHGFFDMLAQRFTGLYVKAGAKHRPTRNPALAEQVLAAAAGLGTPHLVEGLATPIQALLYHTGVLASRSRSAERLRGMLCEETGADVRIIEFAGGWTRLPVSEQTRLPAAGLAGQHLRLGIDAAVGLQTWDAAARFMIHLGPLSLAAFKALLPGAPRHQRLVELTRLHVGLEEDFAFNPVLAADQVPALQLASRLAPGAQLGWTSWLNAPRPRRAPAADAVLRPRSA